jgi:hypothetical protein
MGILDLLAEGGRNRCGHNAGRFAALILFVTVLTASMLGGCGSDDNDNGEQNTGATSTAVKTQKSRTGTTAESGAPLFGAPQVGTHDLESFLPLSAASFSDGVAILGYDTSGADESGRTLAILRPLEDGSNWVMATIGGGERYPQGAAELGSTQVVAGWYVASDVPGGPGVPFVAVASDASGGIFELSDIGQSIFGGRSTQINAIDLSGSPLNPDTQFVMVGGTVTSQNGDLGNATDPRPFALTSSDGYSWQPTADLPLPAGVTGAVAWSVTYAPEGTGYPGLLVAGTGFADDPKITLRSVAILWQSTDGGQTWNIIPDDSFSQEGRNIGATDIACDGYNIVMAGRGDVQGGQAGQSGAIAWAIMGDGGVNSFIDSLDPDRSSYTRSLISLPGGGFLTTTEIFDIGTTGTNPDEPIMGNPISKAWFSPDGADWMELSSIEGIDSAAVISGISQFDGRVVFSGIDSGSVAKAYVIAESTLQ